MPRLGFGSRREIQLAEKTLQEVHGINNVNDALRRFRRTSIDEETANHLWAAMGRDSAIQKLISATRES